MDFFFFLDTTKTIFLILARAFVNICCCEARGKTKKNCLRCVFLKKIHYELSKTSLIFWNKTKTFYAKKFSLVNIIRVEVFRIIEVNVAELSGGVSVSGHGPGQGGVGGLKDGGAPRGGGSPWGQGRGAFVETGGPLEVALYDLGGRVLAGGGQLLQQGCKFGHIAVKHRHKTRGRGPSDINALLVSGPRQDFGQGNWSILITTEFKTGMELTLKSIKTNWWKIMQNQSLSESFLIEHNTYSYNNST